MVYDATNRDPDVEKLLDELPEKESAIYRFMRSRYEVLSEEGEKESTEFDDEVTKEVVEKFSVDSEEANKIYLDVDTKIHNMQMER